MGKERESKKEIVKKTQKRQPILCIVIVFWKKEKSIYRHTHTRNEWDGMRNKHF